MQPLEEIRRTSKVPIAVGFGISTPDQAATVAQNADGIVVGSALISLISKNRENPDLHKAVEQYLHSLKTAIGETAGSAAAGS